MEMNLKRDLRLTTNGQWEPINVLEGIEDGGDVKSWLKEQGWEPFLKIGDQDGSLYITTWRRRHQDEDTPTRYLLEVGNAVGFSPYLMTESFVDLMDLMSRWSPAVQAAAVTDVIDDLTSSGLRNRGLVEKIAARAAIGVTETAGALRAERAEHRKHARVPR
ncbi:hypothetical protein PV646_09820 [Streptomyces sp. ID05-26A]|nr:hypothetical protein [Streptomyces sp. ID05-26A]